MAKLPLLLMRGEPNIKPGVVDSGVNGTRRRPFCLSFCMRIGVINKACLNKLKLFS